MYVTDRIEKQELGIQIVEVEDADFKFLTKSRFWFDWRKEREFDLYKLVLVDESEILGLMSLEWFSRESRIEIRLLAVSKENRGKNKRFDKIAGNLIAFAGKKAIEEFGVWACISLVPKTSLVKHYMEKYSMMIAGKSLVLDGAELVRLVLKYNYD